MVFEMKNRFNQRYSLLKDKVSLSRAQELKKTTLRILTAFAKKSIADKRYKKIEELVSEQLKIAKTKRLFRALRTFSEWQRKWILQVQ